jgi:hypothetical protein
MSWFWIATLIVLLICGVCGAMVGEAKQADSPGFWFGLLLGPVGVVAAGFLDRRPQCSKCGGRINCKATAGAWYSICQHCGRSLRDQASKSVVASSFNDDWNQHLEDAASKLQSVESENTFANFVHGE